MKLIIELDNVDKCYSDIQKVIDKLREIDGIKECGGSMTNDSSRRFFIEEKNNSFFIEKEGN